MVAVGVVVLLIVVGVLCIGAVEVDCTGVADILVLGFLWWRWWKKWNWWVCVSVGGCLFGIVIWVDFFVLFEHDFLGKMEVVVEVVMVEAGCQLKAVDVLSN